MASGFQIKVEAKTLPDAIQAFGMLHKKTNNGQDVALYKLCALHGGAFAAAWAICNVDISVVAAAITVAADGRDLARMTLPDDCHAKCTGKLEVLSAKSSAFEVQGFSIKRRFGCKRDLIETLACATTMPTVAQFLLTPCTIMRHSALMQEPSAVLAQWGPTTEWDVCPSLPTTRPASFTTLPPCPVEESVGLFYLSQASTS